MLRDVGRAFTVVEVLVIIALITLLIGILGPALGVARSSARETACAVAQRRLFDATAIWSLKNRDMLPGINTTGRKYLGDLQNVQTMLFYSTPDTPTSVYDWISPVIGESAGLDANRARRTKQIFEDLGCAAAGEQNDKLFGTAPDKATDFQPLLESEGIGQISYLAPGAFQLLGPAPNADGRRFGWRGPAIPPVRYRPRMDLVGKQMAEKIFVADGTRYVTRRGVLDFDVDPTPRYYGSFTSSSPIYTASTAYGQKPQSAEFAGERRETVSNYPKNRDLSYRHRGRINVTYFDGHVGALDEPTSKRDAAPWYPSGSRFTGEKATEESLGFHQVGDILR